MSKYFPRLSSQSCVIDSIDTLIDNNRNQLFITTLENHPIDFTCNGNENSR
ncbi:unnamed protein product [Brugia pahangi]|uniref:Uncharacterized protein n=1 Tax=Brugia pahangi TaxID=6280 RepID=A0A0N4T313_BRUPA|nr:unnamed protein product [Brugia pahangi]